MSITFILATSILLQLTAVAVAFALARESELKRAWLAIAGALLLMMVPRTITLVKLASGEISQPPQIEAELVALDVSFLLGVGMAWVAKLFRKLKRAHTEMTHSQEALIASESRLKILFEHAPDAFFLFDMDGTVVDVNRAAVALSGTNRESLVGSRTGENDFVPNVIYPRLQNGNSNVSLDGTTPCEWIVTRADGASVIAELRTHLVDIGGIRCLLVIARDVSERRRAEEEKSKLEAQLRHLDRMQTVGTLAGGIAHDFNNILTPILGYAQLAAEEMKPSIGSRAHVDQVIRAAYRARDLVKQILLFSRQTEQEYRPLQLQPLVKEVMKLMRASLPTTIEIECHLNDDGQAVNADASQIHQVVMNLCTNAFQAIGDRCGSLRVTLESVEVDSATAASIANLCTGPHIRLEISDSGNGIEPAVLSRVFEPFFTTKAAGEGTGLGLALVHGIVTAHRGAIGVKSVLGQGTVFSVYFPICQKSVSKTESDSEASLPGTERILLVDDDPEIALLVENMITRLGYRVTIRTSSREALEAFRSRPDEFDVVVTDLTMPGMTGIQLSREIKNLRPGVPVILMTGFSQQISADNCLQWGLDAFVLKPVITGVLSQAIRRAITKTAPVNGASS